MKKFMAWVKEHKQLVEADWQSSKPANSTAVPNHTAKTNDFNPHAATKADIDTNSPIYKLSDFVNKKIDALTWDYGHDAVEAVINAVMYAAPLAKLECEHLRKLWQNFREKLRRGIKETAWWGPRSGPPNPALYDSVLIQIKNLSHLFTQMKILVDQSGSHDLAESFLTFLKEYDEIMPDMENFIEKLRSNTKRH